MNNLTQNFFKKMIELLPTTRQKYDESIRLNGEMMETVIIEEVFMPEIFKLLSEDKETEKLQNIFDYVEKVVNEDIHLRDILSITMMEILGNDKKIMGVARKYLGRTSLKLQIEANEELGRT